MLKFFRTIRKKLLENLPSGQEANNNGKPVFPVRRYLLVVVFSCIAGELQAQSQNLIFRNITPDEGLPVTTVTDVAQDSYGFIWIGSWYGVYRYDGNSFEKISDRGRYITADKKGGIWISYNRIDNGKGTVAFHNPLADSLSFFELQGWEGGFPRLTIDVTGIVWAESENGLYFFNEETNVFETDTLARSDYGYYQIIPHENGTISFFYRDTTSTWGIGNRSKSGKFQYEDFPNDRNNPDPTLSFNASSFPQMEAYLDNGILLLNEYGWAYKENFSSEWTFIKPEKPDILSNTGDMISRNQELYVRHINALTKFNIQTGNSTTYRHNPLIPKSILPEEQLFAGARLFIDRQDVLWIPSFTYGFSRLNLYKSDFGLLRFKDGIPVRDVISAVEIEDGSFWIGSRIDENGLLHFNSDGEIIKRYSGPFNSPPGRSVSNKLSHPFVWSLALGSDGSIWAGTGSPNPNHGGLNRIRPGSDQINRFKHDPDDTASLYQGNWVGEIIEDGSGRIWIMDFSQIAWIDPETEIITRYQHPQNKGREENGRVFMMKTDTGDIIISSQNNTYHRIHHKDLSTKIIDLRFDWARFTSIYKQDTHGNYWALNNRGFGVLNTSMTAIEKWYAFESFNLPATRISSLHFDEQNNIWLQSENGIIRFDTTTEKVTHYTYERGLQGYTFGGRVNYRGPSGKLYFGDNGGINIFDPEKIQINPHPPEMVFTRITLDGDDLPLEANQSLATLMNSGEAISIQPDISTLGFEFAALHFAGDNSNKYQFKLDGFDADWRDGRRVGQATYTNLSPGNYTFRIKGSNLDGVWSDGSAAITFRVLPPWYRTWWAFGFYFILLVAGIVTTDRIQRKRVQQKEREKAREKELDQAKEIEKAYKELEITHENLKSTQAQLIQSEKMASLGELTAGIAHEIQNPLNFVNNFSEVNTELSDEIAEEAEKGNLDEIKIIAKDIKDNSEKISHHGKRAESIVKGMLLHSRGSSGHKEPVDINALCDEYLRLSYHGFRAKDKSFIAEYKTDFDPNLPKINVVPQDIGRVLLNLINNAFYAVDERSKKGEPGFAPTVTVTTRQTASSQLQVAIKDNGPGIPTSIKDKIFQPFFTTKPTGQGTGLGLSLAYDIVKAHGGEIKVESSENKGTEFIIQLPVS